MLQATMFYTDLTQIDFAYVSDAGSIVGMSVSLQIKVKGNVDPVESVVIDFSTFKKDIKSVVDGTKGLDHKLLLSETLCPSLLLAVEGEDEDNLIVTFGTKALEGFMPKGATIIHNVDTTDMDTSTQLNETRLLRAVVESHLTEIISEYFADNNIDATAEVSAVIHGLDTKQNGLPVCGGEQLYAEFFSYSHGLKDSTSYGCQNIAHGHRSYIAFECVGDNYYMSRKAHALRARIARDIDGAMLINQENILFNDETSPEFTIGYTTGRGAFELVIKREEQKHIIMPHETTCEFIAMWVNEHYGARLKAFGIKTVFISEGVNKGSFIEL